MAAYSAEDFFEAPSEENFSDLQSSAERMGTWEEVRKGILHYLWSGIRPDEDENGEVEWPLPSPEVKGVRRIPRYARRSFPKNELLIRIALLEGRNEDAVEMYSAFRDNRICSGGLDELVARSVQESHPDLSLKIWEEIAQSPIALGKPKHYYEAAAYLKKIRTLLHRNERQEEWEALIAKLREERIDAIGNCRRNDP